MSENIFPWIPYKKCNFIVNLCKCNQRCHFQVCEPFRCGLRFSCCGYRECGVEAAYPLVFFLDTWPTGYESKKTVVLCHAMLGRVFLQVWYQQWVGCQEENGRRESVEGVPWDVGWEKIRVKIKENQSILSLCGTVSHTARLQSNSFHCDLNPWRVVAGHGCSCPVPSTMEAEDTKDVELPSRPAWVS